MGGWTFRKVFIVRNVVITYAGLQEQCNEYYRRIFSFFFHFWPFFSIFFFFFLRLCDIHGTAFKKERVLRRSRNARRTPPRAFAVLWCDSHTNTNWARASSPRYGARGEAKRPVCVVKVRTDSVSALRRYVPLQREEDKSRNARFSRERERDCTPRAVRLSETGRPSVPTPPPCAARASLAHITYYYIIHRRI